MTKTVLYLFLPLQIAMVQEVVAVLVVAEEAGVVVEEAVTLPMAEAGVVEAVTLPSCYFQLIKEEALEEVPWCYLLMYQTRSFPDLSFH